jgi:hypothetical protein
MSEYIMLIVNVSVICAIIKILSPSNEALAFVMRIVIVCMLLSPLVNVMNNYCENGEFVVINGENEHTIDNKEADLIWRRYMAKETATKLKDELEARISEAYKVSVEVSVPWKEEDGNIVFEIIMVKADCSEQTCKNIENWIRLHYSLESVCVSGG